MEPDAPPPGEIEEDASGSDNEDGDIFGGAFALQRKTDAGPMSVTDSGRGAQQDDDEEQERSPGSPLPVPKDGNTTEVLPCKSISDSVDVTLLQLLTKGLSPNLVRICLLSF